MANEPLIYGGLFSFVTAVATAYFTWKQTTKVAETQAKAELDKANAQVGVKRLENESALQNHFHSDMVAERERANKLAEELRETQRDKYQAVAQLETCNKEKADWEEERKEHKEEMSIALHANRTLEARLQGLEWIETALTDPALLVQLLTTAQRRLESKEKEKSNTDAKPTS